MRILVTTDTVGGVWTYAATLVRGLVERGDECLVAALGVPSPSQREALPEGVRLEHADHTLEWLPHATAEDILEGAAWIRELARSWGADLVHVNQFGYAAHDLGAPAMVVAHSDVFSWFREVQDREPGPEWAEYREWVRAGLAGAACIVAPTCYQSGMLARHYGRPADRVIHNGSAVRSGADGHRASARPFVATAGRAWDEAKGVAILDEALMLLGDDAPPGHLAGSLEGPDGQVYVPRRLNAHGRVGPGAMARLYENAAIYVATSLYEPFGLSPLEAAGHGCGLVLADIGSFRELWQDAAVFVPPDSPGALATAIRELLAEPARLDALAASARSRARERYTVAAMVDRYRAQYRDMFAGGGAEGLAGDPAIENGNEEEPCRKTA